MIFGNQLAFELSFYDILIIELRMRENESVLV